MQAEVVLASTTSI